MLLARIQTPSAGSGAAASTSPVVEVHMMPPTEIKPITATSAESHPYQGGQNSLRIAAMATLPVAA